MKIAFWSPMHGTGVTASLLALAVAMSEESGKRILLTQTHYKMNNLEKPILGNFVSEGFFEETGMDALIRHFKAGRLSYEQVVNCSVGVTDKMSLLAGTKMVNQQSFETDINRDIIVKILSYIESFYDVVLVDTNSGDGNSSKGILEACDLVVVILRQNRDMIEKFMKDNVMDYRKIFFLFSNYDDSSKNNLTNIRHVYKMIKKENSGGIPYSTGYMDAISDDMVMQFMQRHIVTDEMFFDKDFIESIKEVTHKILIYANKFIMERRVLTGEKS